MKKLIFSILFLFLAYFSSAQNTIYEGLISYAVQWKLPDHLLELRDYLPTEVKVYFKGDSSTTKIESQLYSSASILHSLTEVEQLLVEIPMLHKKYVVSLTPADQKKISDKMLPINLKVASETKTVLGYHAQRYTWVEKKSGQVFEAWFTRDLDITTNSLSRFYDKKYGLPLEFTTFLNGFLVTALVTEIKSSAVPSDSFSIKEDYEPITWDQLMKLSGAL